MPHQELYNKLVEGNAGTTNPKEFLQALTREYPYFSLAHFFLLKETTSTDFSYKKTAAKTALHFNNPYLLQYQLTKKVAAEKIDVIDNVVNVPPIQEKEKVTPLNADTISLEAEGNAEIKTVLIPENIEDVEIIDEVLKVEQGESAMNLVPIERIKEVETENVGSPAPLVAPGEELLFEPLYTSDYFASQGIKLSEEVQTGDKLGKQLKSFTDWLKTMKKTHQGKLPEGSTSIDLAVQSLAEKSNKEQEIITEAMAEVFVQQGKKAKANELYKKLSLLNPAKSAYFTAKIELLKEN
ncbi:MAG: hypothetical protein H7258_13915 [Ferruginibacter sp.]|nr:hypothetical protein [Ferruginibacter sp.]